MWLSVRTDVSKELSASITRVTLLTSFIMKMVALVTVMHPPQK
jgi:hypothetical protein